MKASTVRHAVEAHGWVGLIISVPLFIIFWAGAVTLFHPEVERWSTMPHYPLSGSEATLPLDEVVEDKIAQYDFDSSHRLRLHLPGEHTPYLWMELPLLEPLPEASGHHAQHVHLMIDPVSGETLSTSEPFQLADFINQLHFNLKLPQGLYLVGIVTFFFLVLVMTGLVIQLKNLFKNFFLYRNNSTTRSQVNDIHTVVGVISLPYGLMYALTGVMFNLSIIFQITTMLTLYQGDMQTMMEDAGFASYQAEMTEQAASMPDLDTLLQKVESQANTTVHTISIQNYGDQSALIGFSGLENGSFARSVDRFYQLSTDSFPEAMNPQQHNLFTDGVNMLFSLHMANYAGVDLRLLYFLLAIGVCAMIVAGNLLWMTKRQKQSRHARTLAVMRGLTLGGTMGTITATAMAFLLERVLPVALTDRGEWMMTGFGLTLLLSVVMAYLNRRYLRYLGWSCVLSALLLLGAVVVDSTLMTAVIASLWQAGFPQVAAISLGLLLFALLLGGLGLLLLRREAKQSITVQAGHL